MELELIVDVSVMFQDRQARMKTYLPTYSPMHLFQAHRIVKEIIFDFKVVMHSLADLKMVLSG